MCQEMPRNHGPEGVSEVEELDLALWLRGLAISEGWRDLDDGRFDGRVSVLTLDAYAGSTTVIALECLCWAWCSSVWIFSCFFRS